MKQSSIVSFLLIILSMAVQAQFREAETAHRAYFERPAESYKMKAHPTEATHLSDWDLTFNRLDLEVDPAVRAISGKVLFQFKAKTNNLLQLTIHLSEDLTIEQIASNQTPLQYSRMGNEVLVTLPRVLQTNQTDSFVVRYAGIPTSTGFGSFTQAFHGPDNVPVLFTLSEPYGALEWWPCKQSLSDKIDSIDVRVTSPLAFRTASNGLLTETVNANGTRTCHWKHRHPIATYLVFFSTTNYEMYTEEATFTDGTRMPILNMVYPEVLETAKQQTARTKDILEFYSRKLIDYPFKNEKYGHAQFSWGGGMEHQTMSSMGGFGFDLVAHELAHQWFGDYITCGSWQEIWLNEGFATYLTGLAYEEFHNDTWWQQWHPNIINRVTSQPGGSVWVSDTSNVWTVFDSRLSYNKAAYVLHMLRGQLGDQHFFDGLRRYLTDSRVTNGFATTALFRENMELGADTTLTEFLNDWILGEGHPIYTYSLSKLNEQLVFNLSQTPSAPNGPFFEMRIPIRIWNKGTSSDIWIDNKQVQQSFVLGEVQQIDSIQFDPDQWILCTHSGASKLAGTDSLDNGFKMYPNPSNGRITIQWSRSPHFDISIFDLNGKLIWKQPSTGAQTEIGTKKWSPGAYIVQVECENQRLRSTLLVGAP